MGNRQQSVKYQNWLIYSCFIIKRDPTLLFKKFNTRCFRISTQLCVSVAWKLLEYFLQSKMSTRLRHTALSAWPLHYNKVSVDQEAASILFSAVQSFSVRTLCIDYPNFQSREGGIEIQEAWMPTIKNKTTGEPCDSELPRVQVTEWNSKDRNAPIRAVEKQLITAEHHAL